MDWHDKQGCAGERITPCPCRRNQEMVLEAAIDAVRSDPDRWQAHFESARGKASS
jgi:hypothetical protein